MNKQSRNKLHKKTRKMRGGSNSPNDKIKNNVANLGKQIAKARNAVDSAKEKIVKLETKAAKIQKKLHDAEEKLHDAEKKLHDAESVEAKLVEELKGVLRSIVPKSSVRIRLTRRGGGRRRGRRHESRRRR